MSGQQSVSTLRPSAAASARSHVPATTLLSEAVAALDQIHSFRLEATWFYYDFVPRTLSAEFSLPGRFMLSINSGGETVKFVVLGSSAYVRGNVRYWAGYVSAPNVVHLLASNWVKLPASAVPNLAAYQALAQPRTVGRCALGLAAESVSGPLSADLNGRTRSVLDLHVDDGRAGSGRDDILLSAGGTPLPLSISQAGSTTPSPHNPACGQLQTQPNPVRTAVIFFSHYNDTIRIAAPSRWIGSSRLTEAIRESSPKLAPTDPSVRLRQEREMLGTWIATGTIIQSHGFANGQSGSTFQRLWEIRENCTRGQCRPYMTRTTSTGPVSTWLAWTGDHWTASFVMTIACSDGTANTEYANWTIHVRRGAIAAVERDRTTGSCPTSTSVVRWEARRTHAPGGSASA